MDEQIVPQVFDNPEFGSIRVVRDDGGEPWFVAKDVCEALGIRTDTIRAILDEDEVSEISNPSSIGFTHGRAPLIVSEAGLYSLVLKSRKPEAKAFKRWVTHEVLPAIRRDGGYMVARDETPEETMARAVLLAQRTIERQKAQIEEMRPKALFADAVSASDGTCLVGELAKMLTQSGFTIGQNRLFKLLRDDGFLGKRGSNRNVPLQRYVEQGLFRIKETAVAHSDGHVTINRTTKVTGRGQAYFVKRYSEGVDER
nr:phage antirepressor KilAC domain-containing protein [uncultured Olsenella sp.]